MVCDMLNRGMQRERGGQTQVIPLILFQSISFMNVECIACLQFTKVFGQVQTVAIVWKQRERVVSLYMTDKQKGPRKGDAPWVTNKLAADCQLRSLNCVLLVWFEQRATHHLAVHMRELQ